MVAYRQARVGTGRPHPILRELGLGPPSASPRPRSCRRRTRGESPSPPASPTVATGGVRRGRVGEHPRWAVTGSCTSRTLAGRRGRGLVTRSQAHRGTNCYTPSDPATRSGRSRAASPHFTWIPMAATFPIRPHPGHAGAHGPDAELPRRVDEGSSNASRLVACRRRILVLPPVAWPIVGTDPPRTPGPPRSLGRGGRPRARAGPRAEWTDPRLWWGDARREGDGPGHPRPRRRGRRSGCPRPRPRTCGPGGRGRGGESRPGFDRAV